MVDAIPGIVLSFQTHLTLTQFGVNHPAWAPAALDDQHTAGGILWAVAEVLDLPFLVLAATRWMRADAVEARRIDAELDAESPAAAASTPPQRPADGTAVPVVAGDAPTARHIRTRRRRPGRGGWTTPSCGTATGADGRDRHSPTRPGTCRGRGSAHAGRSRR